jgi:hypothetical protein
MPAVNRLAIHAVVLSLTLVSNALFADDTHSAIKSEREAIADFLSKNYSKEVEGKEIHDYASTMLSSLGCGDFLKTSWKEGKRLAILPAESFNNPDKLYRYYRDAALNLFGEDFERRGKGVMQTLAKLHKLFAVDLERDFEVRNNDLVAFFSALQKKKAEDYTRAERDFVREFYSLSRKLVGYSEDLAIPCDKKLRKPEKGEDEGERANWGAKSQHLIIDDPMSYARQSLDCRERIPRNVRSFVYDHFTRFLRSKLKKAEKVSADDLHLFSERMGYIIPESYYGFASTVTDMNYRGTGSKPFRTENPKGIPIINWILGKDKITERDNVRTSLASWRAAIDVDEVKTVSINKQTNFGLLQMSADRLTWPKSGIIFQRQIESLKLAAVSNPDALLEFCQTEKFYKDPREDLIGAFRGISSCKASPDSKDGVKCFGAWAMLCPAFNLDLGMAAPQAYFSKDTRRKAPLVCQEALQSILEQYRMSFPASGI